MTIRVGNNFHVSWVVGYTFLMLHALPRNNLLVTVRISFRVLWLRTNKYCHKTNITLANLGSFYDALSTACVTQGRMMKREGLRMWERAGWLGPSSRNKNATIWSTTATEKQDMHQQNLARCHFSRYKSHTDCSRLNWSPYSVTNWVSLPELPYGPQQICKYRDLDGCWVSIHYNSCRILRHRLLFKFSYFHSVSRRMLIKGFKICHDSFLQPHSTFIITLPFEATCL
jgi:hypothetical protein